MGSSGAQPFRQAIDVREFGTYDPTASATVNTQTGINAIAGVRAMGGGDIWVPRSASGAFYQMGRTDPASQSKGCFHLLPTVGMRSNGVRIQLASAFGGPINCAFVTATSTLSATATTTITADTAVSTTTLTVTSSANFAVGNDVYIRLGQAPYDVAEPDYWFYAAIVTIPDGTHITLDRPCGYAMSVAGTTDVNQRKVTRVDEFYENAGIEGRYEFLATTSGPAAIAEFGVSLLYARSIKVGTIIATNPGAGAIHGQWCEDLNIDEIRVKNSDAMSTAAHGRGIDISECRNVTIDVANLKDCQDYFVKAEAGTQNFRIKSLIVDNAYNGVRTNSGILATFYRSQISTGSMVYRGNQATVMHESGGASGQIGNAVSIDQAVDQTGAAHSNWLANEVNRSFVVDGVNFTKIRTWTKRIPLTASMTNLATTLPSGYVRSCKVVASSAVTGLTKFALKSAAETASAHASIVASTSVYLANVEQMTLNHNLAVAKSIVISTSGAGAGHLIVELEYWEDTSGTVLQTTYDSTGLLQ